MTRDRSLPGRVGPIAGPASGGRSGRRDPFPGHRVPILLGAAAMGLVAGFVVWSHDAREGR